MGLENETWLEIVMQTGVGVKLEMETYTETNKKIQRPQDNEKSGLEFQGGGEEAGDEKGTGNHLPRGETRKAGTATRAVAAAEAVSTNVT